MIFGNNKAPSIPSVPAWSEIGGDVVSSSAVSVASSLRRFGKKEDEVSVTLYRDSAAWCPYCQKCLILLEEQETAYKVEKVNMACYGDKPREFLRLQPSGTLPAAVFDGRVLRSSDAIILETLESKRASPLDVRSDPRCGRLLDLERQHFSAWLRWLTGGEGGRNAFIATLERVEAEIDGPYFFGDRFTFVDVMYAPFLERMAASLAYFKGYVVRSSARERVGDPDLDAWTKFPKLNGWFDAMESREAYRFTMSDWYTHAHDLPPQLGGCVKARTPAAEAVRADVDGGAWHDSPPKFEPLWPWIENAGPEAASKLKANAPAVARFAARGAAPPGFPPFRADLADPNAAPNDRIVPLVDAALRKIAVNLLDPASSGYDDFVIDKSDASDLKKCIVYLRDRVSVPRDMSFNAAQALRVECNRVIAKL